MAVRTTGVEWKRFFNDRAAWRPGVRYEDAEIIVDDKLWEGDAADLATIPDSAFLSISGGIVYLLLSDTNGPTLEVYFRRWRRLQNTVFITCEAPRTSADAVRDAIIAAGGLVLTL